MIPVLLGLSLLVLAGASLFLMLGAWGRRRKPMKLAALSFSTLALVLSGVAVVYLVRRVAEPVPAAVKPVQELLIGKTCWPVCWRDRGNGELCCGNATTLLECAQRGGGVGQYTPGPCPTGL